MGIVSRHQYHAYKQGFTIVELIVIIVVMGILTSVGFFAYGAWRERIAETEVKNDLTAVATAMDSARNWDNGYPELTPGTVFDGNDTTKNIYVQSEGVTLTYYQGDDKAYCIDARSVSRPQIQYFLNVADGEKEPQPGSCQYGNFLPGETVMVWTWTHRPAFDDWWDGIISNDGLVVAQFDDTRYQVSRDGGATIAHSSSSPDYNPATPSILTMSADGQSLAYSGEWSRDGGATFETAWVGPGGSHFAVGMVSPDGQKFYRYTGGWSGYLDVVSNVTIDHTDSPNRVTPVAFGNDTRVVGAGHANSSQYFTAVGGSGFQPLANPPGVSSYRVGYSANPSGILLAASTDTEPGRLFKSTDAGQSWTYLESAGRTRDLSSYGQYDAGVASVDGQRLLIRRSDGVYSSIDGGTTWRLEPSLGSDVSSLYISPNGQYATAYSNSNGGFFTGSLQQN